ncbi:MAG: pyruvate ferredoxin oxidoreductase [Casimicrobiaceae bacterium]
MQKRSDACHAVAQTIAMCRPALICAHPDAALARILDGLGELEKSGKLAHCEFVNVESDFAAMSVAIGASATGARTYTLATSQGLMFMAEAVHNAAGLALPIVMTIGSFAAGAPVNTWNDDTVGMSMRDAGWIQLYAETGQEALDLHVQAFRLAEAVSCPVMVCVDGTMLAPGSDGVEPPTQAQVDAYLPPFGTRRARGARNTIGAGAAAGPATFMEMRYLAHHKQLRALSVIPRLAGEFLAQTGRSSGGLLRTYLTDDAETIVVAMGAVNATVREVVDELRADGARIGSVSLCSFRPFPMGVLRDALQHAKRVVVLERSLAVGLGGILSDGVSKSVSGIALNAYTVIAGLGGRAIGKSSLRQLFDDASRDELEHITFLDLNAEVVAGQLEREARKCSAVPELHASADAAR